VVHRYPVGGIGLGAFRYEMDNVARLDGAQWRWLDNANNSYLQMAAELGLIGLAIVLLTLGVIAYKIIGAVRSPRLSGDDRVTRPAVAAAWFGFVFLLLTAVWLLFEQIQVMFWVFAAVIIEHGGEIPAGEAKRRRWFIPLIMASVAIVAVSQMVHGFGDLSPARRRIALGLEQGEGFHDWERDETGRRFRWTGEEARQIVTTALGEIRIEALARNPDLTSHPLTLWISLGGKTVARCEITSSSWRWVRVPVPLNTPNPAELCIRVERTWSPKDWGLGTDDRALGVAVGRIENALPGEPLPP
jgi:hypothetical protein